MGFNSGFKGLTCRVCTARASLCSAVMWRLLVTHFIPLFPLNFSSPASPCAITFQLDSMLFRNVGSHQSCCMAWQPISAMEAWNRTKLLVQLYFGRFMSMHKTSHFYFISSLSLHNKLIIYKQILKPVWTYGIQLWGCTKQSNINIIQRFQDKVLRQMVNAPWYIRNNDLHRDLQVDVVSSEIQRFAQKHSCSLSLLQ